MSEVERCWLCHKILLTPAVTELVSYEQVCHCAEPETTALEDRLDALEEQISELKELIQQRDSESVVAGESALAAKGGGGRLPKDANKRRALPHLDGAK